MRVTLFRHSWLPAGCVIVVITLLMSGTVLCAETSASPQPAVDARVEVVVGEGSAGCVRFWLPRTVDVGTAEELAARVAETQGWAVESLLVDSGEYGTWVEFYVDGFLPAAGPSRKFQLDVTSIAALLDRYGVSAFELAVGAERPHRLRLSSGSEWLAGTEVSEFSDGERSWISVDLLAAKRGRGDLHGRGAGEGARVGAIGALEFEVRFPAWPAIWRLLLIVAALLAVQALVRARGLKAIARASHEEAGEVLWRVRRSASTTMTAGMAAVLLLIYATDSPDVFLHALGVASARAKFLLTMLTYFVPAAAAVVFGTIAMYDVVAQVRNVRWSKRDAVMRTAARLVIPGVPLLMWIALFLILPKAALKELYGNWTYAALVWAGIAVVPVVVEPLRVWAWLGSGLMPVQDERVMGAVRELSEKAGIKVKGACVVKSGPFQEVNAGMMIIARRVVFTDRLLAIMPINELKCVIGHELAHIKLAWRSHLIDMIGSLRNSALLAGGCAGAAEPAFNLELSPAAEAFVAAGFVLALASWAMNEFKRVTELRADRFAVEFTADPTSCIKAYHRMALLNVLPVKGPGGDRPYATHPSVWKRITDIAAAAGVDELKLSELMQEVESELTL